MTKVLSYTHIQKHIAVAVMGIAICFGMFANAQRAEAMSVSDLQSQIDALLGTIAALQSQIVSLNVDSSGSSDAEEVDDYSWSRNLTVGARGEDVRRLQKFLNEDDDTTIASYGDGSKGRETYYFGPATARALKKFQEKHAADVLAPHGLGS